jgi:putative DNA primase/helicase
MAKTKVQDIVREFLGYQNMGAKLLFCEETKDLWHLEEYLWWKRIEPYYFLRDLNKFLLANYPDNNVDEAYLNNIFTTIKYHIPHTTKTMDSNHICFTDCMLDMTNFTTSKHDEDLLSTHFIPKYYTELSTNTLEHPAWDHFLKTSLVEKEDPLTTDPELINLTQEMMGYFLVPNPKKGQTAFFLVGDGANGKSVLLEILKEIVGREFVSASSIESLTNDKFGLPSLIGKKVNICNEEESKHIRVDKFKALVSGDEVEGQYKFGDHFKYIPRVKFVFATNNTPGFTDLNHATLRRVKILPFNRRFNESDPDTDPDLLEKLIPEIPAILAWVLEGAKRFLDNGYKFSPSRQSKTAHDTFADEVSSGVMFFREAYNISPSLFTSNDDLYASYKSWCEKNGRKPLASHNFGKNLLSSFVNLKSITRTVEGRSLRGRNCALKNPEDDIPGIDIGDIPI